MAPGDVKLKCSASPRACSRKPKTPSFGVNDFETCIVSGPAQCVLLRPPIQGGRLSIIEMNDRPESVSREEGVNVRFWVEL